MSNSTIGTIERYHHDVIAAGALAEVHNATLPSQHSIHSAATYTDHQSIAGTHGSQRSVLTPGTVVGEQNPGSLDIKSVDSYHSATNKVFKTPALNAKNARLPQVTAEAKSPPAPRTGKVKPTNSEIHDKLGLLFPKNRKLGKVPLETLKLKMVRPTATAGLERPRGCCARLFGGRVKRSEDWPHPVVLRRTRSLPRGLRLPEVWPKHEIWRPPYLSYSLPVLPSMATADDEVDIDIDVAKETDEQKQMFAKISGHTVSDQAVKSALINTFKTNFNANNRTSNVPINELDNTSMVEEEVEEHQVITDVERTQKVTVVEEEYEVDEDLPACASLPGRIALYDQHPRMQRWVPAGISKSLPDIQFLTERAPAFKRKLHIWEIFKLQNRVLCKVFVPFLPNKCLHIPDDDVFNEAWEFLEEEQERQEHLRSMETRLLEMEKLAVDRFAINLQRNYRKTIRILAEAAAHTEEQRKAEAVILLAILRHIHLFRMTFKAK